MNIDDCYQILELKPDATIEEIKAARNELLQVWHPDKYTSNSKLSKRAKEKTQKINDAFVILVKHIKAEQFYLEKPQQNYQLRNNQTIRKKYSQKQKENDIYLEEMKRVVKEQEARLDFIEWRRNVEKRAKRQLKNSFMFAMLAGFIGLAVGLKESAWFPFIIVVVIGVIRSFLTVRQNIKK